MTAHIKLFEDFNQSTVDITSDQLRLSIDAHKYKVGSAYGTPCGHTPYCYRGLSNEVIAEFIDVFFGGILDNLDVKEEKDYTLVYGGEPTLKKLTITNAEFDYFTLKLKDRKNFLYNLTRFLNIKKSKLTDVENKVDEERHPTIICHLFSSLVDDTGSSLRCQYMQDGKIDLESE